jgi:hypothetical protein
MLELLIAIIIYLPILMALGIARTIANTRAVLGAV